MKDSISELRSIARLGLPLVLAQLTTMAMAVTDAIIVGRGAGTESLAAMAFALNFMNMPLVGLYGFAAATSILVARAYGAGQRDEMPQILRHGLFISFISGVTVVFLMVAAFWNLHRVNYLGQPPELIPIAKPYVLCYGAAFVFMLCAGNCRAFCESQNRPWLVMFGVLASIVLNAILDYLLVFGPFGLPRLGLVGAGLATLFSAMTQLLILLVLAVRAKDINLCLDDLRHFRLERSFMGRHIRLGVPTSLQIGMEISSMSILAVLVGRLGAATLAAHHVTIQIIVLAFMVPLGMSFAVSIRVGQAAGANDRPRVLRICKGAMLFAAGWASLASLGMLVLRHQLPLLFTNDPLVVPLVASFLVVGGLFQLFDSVQCTAMGALRGLRDVTLPTVVVMLNHWVLSLPLAWLLCFELGLGGLGVWMAMAVALILTAGLLCIRLHRVATRGVLAE